MHFERVHHTAPTAGLAVMSFVVAGLAGHRLPTGGRPFGYQWSRGFDADMLLPATAVVAAAAVAGLALLPRWRRRRQALGWLGVGVGLAILAVSASPEFIQAVMPHAWAISLTIYIPAGLALAGCAVVIAAADNQADDRFGRSGIPVHRVVAAGSFVAGLASAHAVAMVAARNPLLVYGSAAVIALAAAVGSRRSEPAGWTDHSSGMAATVLITIVVCGAWLADGIRRELLAGLANSPTGTSSRRLEIVDSFDRYSSIALAVFVAGTLAWFGLTRGGRHVARWVVAGFALAPAMAAAPSHLLSSGAIAAAGVTGALLGAVTWRYADSRVPWDAIGVAAAAGLLALLVAQSRGSGAPDVSVAMLLATIGFTLMNSILQLLPDDRPPTTLPFASSIALGLAAIVVAAGYLTAELPLERGQDFFPVAMLEIIMGLAIACLIILWKTGGPDERQPGGLGSTRDRTALR